MTSDTDFTPADAGAGDVTADALVSDQALQERERASDERLDAAVRQAADEVYGKQDQPLPALHGRTIDDTIRLTQERIGRREPPPSMPPLRPGHSIDEAVTAAHEWNRTPKAEQRLLSNGARELEAMRSAAESYGLRLETMADVRALKEMQRGDKGQADRAQHETISRAGQSQAQIRQLAAQAGLDANMPIGEVVQYLQHAYGPAPPPSRCAPWRKCTSATMSR